MGEEILWIRGIYKTEMFIRAVIMSKSAGEGGGVGISRGYYECGPRLLHRKIEKVKPKEIPRHLIPRLLVVFTQQLEILLFIFTNATNS